VLDGGVLKAALAEAARLWPAFEAAAAPEVNMTQLERFEAEVVELGAEKCLPRNLSDYWLNAVIESTDALLSGDDPLRSVLAGAAKRGAIALAAVVCILERKADPASGLFVGLEQMAKHLQSYLTELALEKVHRSTGAKYEPATLNDILTDRTVTTWR
jgi:hypothetical protein